MHAYIEVREWVGTRNMVFGYVPSISSKYGLITKIEGKALINQHAFNQLYTFCMYIKPGLSYPF